MKDMLQVVFELFLANRAEEMIWARFRLFYRCGVLFCMGFLLVQIFNIFAVLVLEEFVIFLRVESFVRKGEQRSSKRRRFVEIGIIVLPYVNLGLKRSAQLVLSVRAIDHKVMKLLGKGPGVWLHAT
jgi:hypothetical protein